MIKTKKVKITFHTLMKKMYKEKGSTESKEYPFWEVEDILMYISQLPKIEKFYDIKDGKFCFLESSIKKDIIEEDDFLLSGFIKSARNEFRPNLIDKKTGSERKNPKTINEGDIEKTHFVLKFSKSQNEVYLFLEYNFSGISITNFVNYLTFATKKYFIKDNRKKNFSVTHLEVALDNFFEELKKLSRAAQTEVYFDKRLLGSDALNFSNRTVSLKKDIVLLAKAFNRDNIIEFGIDLWNKMNQKNSPISKLRIKGIDSNDKPILLDTSFMVKNDFVDIDVDQDTGELNTTQLIVGIKNIASSV